MSAQLYETMTGKPKMRLPEERPVALVYNGSTAAVMMASPYSLKDFHLGFALTEGIVTTPQDVTDVEVINHGRGLEVRGRIPEDRAARLDERRRTFAGPVGCGLCGIDSLLQATSHPGDIKVGQIDGIAMVQKCEAAFDDRQILRHEFRAMHAAAYLDDSGLIELREDIGRHNALDKVIGAMRGRDMSQGCILITSRLSIDLVQKCVRAGVAALCGYSSPTMGAVELAQTTGLNLFSRGETGWVRHSGTAAS